MLGKVLWNNDIDYETLARDYFENAFGQDGKAVKMFLERLSEMFYPPYMTVIKFGASFGTSAMQPYAGELHSNTQGVIIDCMEVFMYRVLIAEDEMLVRLGLKNTVPWYKYNMTVVADASDGKTALDMYYREKPDLIVTDLRMPVLNGMDLIAQIRDKDADTRIIILTCLEEFELVQKAVSLGVSDYILKLTMTEDDIERVLLKVSKELDLQKSRTRSLSEFIDTNVIKEKIIKKAVLYQQLSEEDFIRLVEEYQLRLNLKKMQVCLLEINNYEELKVSLSDPYDQQTRLSIINITDKVLENYGAGEIIFDNFNRFVILISPNILKEEGQNKNTGLPGIIDNVCRALKTYLSLTVSAGISSTAGSCTGLHRMYLEARKNLEQCFILGRGVYREYNEHVIAAQLEQYLHRVKEISLNLKHYIISQKELFGTDHLDEYIAYIRKGCFQSRDIVHEGFLWIMQWAIDGIHGNDDIQSSILQDYAQQLRRSDSLYDMIAVYEKFVLEIIPKEYKQQSLSDEMVKVLSFIEENYSRGISLADAAEYVNLSPNYLSSLVKKQLNINFTDYINKVRIEKAQKLLANTNCKLYDIAMQVGYADDSYFNRCFKQIKGMTPNEYRKNRHNKGRDDGIDENR